MSGGVMFFFLTSFSRGCNSMMRLPCNPVKTLNLLSGGAFAGARAASDGSVDNIEKRVLKCAASSASMS